MSEMRSRSLEELLNDPEYIRLKERAAYLTDEINSLNEEDMSNAGPMKWELVEGRIRAYQANLSEISTHMAELSNKQIEAFFSSKLDSNAPIQKVGRDLFSLIK
jgi:hypothetical protein